MRERGRTYDGEVAANDEKMRRQPDEESERDRDDQDMYAQ